jgi:hypothetical protein
MSFLKEIKVGDHFNKLLLAFIFIATCSMCVHLMHKQDAGGNDAAFIAWGEAQAAFVLGRLVSIIVPDVKKDPNGSDPLPTNTP